MRKPVVQVETELHEWTEGDQAAFEDEQLRAQDDDRPRREVSVKRVPTPPASERGPGPERGALGLPEPVGLMAEAQALALTDWPAMDPEERGRAIPVMLRRDVLSKWNAGRALQAHWDYLGQKQDRVAYLKRIGLPRTTAFRFMKLARLDVFQIGTFATEQAALDYIDAQSKPAPVVEPEPGDPPAVEPEVDPDDDPGDDWTAEERRIEEQEREAIRTESDPSFYQKRYREQIDVTKRERRGRLAAERKFTKLLDTLSAVPRGRDESGIDDALAPHGIARKAAA